MQVLSSEAVVGIGVGAGVLVLVALVIAAVLLCARSAHQENIFFIWNFPSHVDPPQILSVPVINNLKEYLELVEPQV